MAVLQSLFIVYLMADNSLNPALSLFSHLTIIGEFFIVGVVHSNNLVKYKEATLKIPRIDNGEMGRRVAAQKKNAARRQRSIARLVFRTIKVAPSTAG
jgi:hypothetical protein